MITQGIFYSITISGLVAVGISHLLILWFRLRRMGQVIRPEGPPSHYSKEGTPTMGGIAVLFGLAAVMLLRLTAGISPTLILLFLGTAAYGMVGYGDDVMKMARRNSGGMSARGKLLWQCFISIALVWAIYRYGGFSMTSLYIPWFFQQPIDIGPVYYPLAVLYLMLLVNAVNLTDGLDGLAAGLGVIAALAALIIAAAGLSVVPGIREGSEAIIGAGEIMHYSGALAGALLGFLIFNRRPAKLFLGDTGSQAVGGALGITALLLRSEVLFLVIGGMFLLEAFSVILQVGSYKLRKKRIFNMAPLHHHYELKGKHESAIVRAFWGIGLLCASAGVLVILFG